MTLVELPTIRNRSPGGLVDALLVEQQSLTAVERFARLHDAGQGSGHEHAAYYRDLLPLTLPQSGEQYAFVVDLDACSGCKACVTACHSLNGLDDSETFRDVGSLMGRDAAGLHILQHVSTACHHCLEPACLEGCPTQAYDKDPATGIVRHLDDQCIGCQYCTLMCPYDVPKYNPAKGIVRKCDMCSQRLAVGEAPACVQACPNQAIRIEVVGRDEVSARATKSEFLPTSPDPRLTLPTTRFVTSRELRDIEATDAHHDRPAHLHLPLVVMLVLTQMSVGMFCVAQSLGMTGSDTMALVLIASIVGFAGLAAAVFHIGRPAIAYRAWLGWRTSWMSREILAFYLFAWLASAWTVCSWLPDVPSASTCLPWLGPATCAAGLASVYCSAMIYVATRREFWSFRRTLPRFLTTTLLLGIACALLVTSLSPAGTHAPRMALAIVMLVGTLARLIIDAAVLRTREEEPTALTRSADLLTGKLKHWFDGQVLAAVVGGILFPLTSLALPQFAGALLVASAVLILIAELIHRGLFFAAVVAPRMPGVSHA